MRYSRFLLILLIMFSGLASGVHTDLTECDKLQDHSKVLLCYTDVAIHLRNASVCAMAGENSTDYCYDHLGEALNESSICDRINDTFWKDSCYNRVGSALKNVSVCDNIKNNYTKGLCYGKIAIYNNDSSLCDMLESQGGKDSCFADVGRALNDPFLCDKVRELWEKDFCYSKVGVVLKDTTICDKTKSQESKDNCYAGMAAALKNQSFCDLIQSELTKDSCYASLGAHYQNSGIGDFFERIFWVDASKKLKNISLCENVKIEYEKSNCYYEVGIDLKSVNGCYKSVYGRDGCYRVVAKELNDSRLCGAITDSGDKGLCYGAVAASLKDQSICMWVPDSLWKDYCYKQVFIVTNDSSVCDKLTYNYEKEDCYNRVGFYSPRITGENIFSVIPGFWLFTLLFGLIDRLIPPVFPIILCLLLVLPALFLGFIVFRLYGISLWKAGLYGALWGFVESVFLSLLLFSTVFIALFVVGASFGGTSTSSLILEPLVLGLMSVVVVGLPVSAIVITINSISAFLGASLARALKR